MFIIEGLGETEIPKSCLKHKDSYIESYINIFWHIFRAFNIVDSMLHFMHTECNVLESIKPIEDSGYVREKKQKFRQSVTESAIHCLRFIDTVLRDKFPKMYKYPEFGSMKTEYLNNMIVLSACCAELAKKEFESNVTDLMFSTLNENSIYYDLQFRYPRNRVVYEYAMNNIRDVRDTRTQDTIELYRTCDDIKKYVYKTVVQPTCEDVMTLLVNKLNINILNLNINSVFEREVE